MIPFKCQSCGQEMSVPDSMAGHFEACPACKALVAIPGPVTAVRWEEGRLKEEPRMNTDHTDQEPASVKSA